MFYILLQFNTVLSLFMIGLMGVLTNIISWVIALFTLTASIAITVVLWTTYLDIRKTQDAKIKYSYFEEFLRNETAIYAMAIIATIIMVSHFALNLLNLVQRTNENHA